MNSVNSKKMPMYLKVFSAVGIVVVYGFMVYCQAGMFYSAMSNRRFEKAVRNFYVVLLWRLLMLEYKKLRTGWFLAERASIEYMDDFVEILMAKKGPYLFKLWHRNQILRDRNKKCAILNKQDVKPRENN